MKKTLITALLLSTLSLSACNKEPSGEDAQPEASMAMEPVEAEGVDALEVSEAEEALNKLSEPERQKIDLLLECDDKASGAEKQLTLARLEQARKEAGDQAKLDACKNQK